MTKTKKQRKELGGENLGRLYTQFPTLIRRGCAVQITGVGGGRGGRARGGKGD